MKQTKEQIEKAFKPYQVFTIEADLEGGAKKTDLVFRKAKRSDYNGPFKELVKKDADFATEQLLKALCLSHEDLELDVIWEDEPGVFDACAMALVRARQDVAREKKAG